MARIIVFAKPDNDHPDPEMDAKKFKRGMVVDILPDGVSAGRDVENGEWWHIIEVPGTEPSKFGHLLGGDPSPSGDEEFHPRKRVHRLDLDALKPGADLAQHTHAVEKRRNARVIGADPKVIG